MASEEHYLFENDEGVAVVTLNRPERMNAVNWDLCGELSALFHRLRSDDEVRVIVLTGAGGNFSSGGDAEFLSGNDEGRPIPGLSDAPRERYQRKTPAGNFAEFTRWIVDVGKPVIAAVPGVCMGAGLAYALACDRRFGDSTTRMSAAMVRLGFAPDCGISYLLPRVVRMPVALNMITTGRIVKAEEAFKEGLIDELCEDGKALEGAMTYARELASGPSVAIDLARHFVWRSLNSTLEEMLDYEGRGDVMAALTEDAREGTSAFLEKRRPVYKGR